MGAVPHAEAIMVLAGEDEIAQAGLLREGNPGGWIASGWRPRPGQALVVGPGHRRRATNMLGAAIDFTPVPYSAEGRIGTPVDEHAEAGFPPPGEPVAGN